MVKVVSAVTRIEARVTEGCVGRVNFDQVLKARLYVVASVQIPRFHRRLVPRKEEGEICGRLCQKPNDWPRGWFRTEEFSSPACRTAGFDAGFNSRGN